MSLSEYFTQLKILWDQLDNTKELDEPCICGKAARWQKKVERSMTVKFLAGLNESYAIVRRQIIAKKVLPSLVEVYNILDQDDSQKNFSPTVAQPAKGRPICLFCNKGCHIVERCYKKHGFPPGYRGKISDKSQKPPIVAAHVSMAPQPTSSNDNLESLIGPSHSAVDYTIISFSPSTFYFVGILAVSQHSLSSGTWDLTRGSTIGQGRRIGNLYVLDTTPPPPSVSVSVNAVVDINMWHKTLGNPFIHEWIDLRAPFSVETVDGYKNFLKLVDDHSRATWVYLLKTESELGFIKVHGDHTLFVKYGESEFVAVLVYVDDIVIASTIEASATQLTNVPKIYFKM
ncbi:PREDICTED: uncharacterized protein LOC109127406 [Camelina sativa]|uniref:Uncharacterized protein LOC109127406 n=1 Tax=Camelina sativa TaxID=90675 RepID=A0ABM1QLF3_CAMSA|nr:PREDICTED: uncharacterized protein LOC109127406 [Camelina sativa]